MSQQIFLQLGYAGGVIAATFLLHGVMILGGRLLFPYLSGREGVTALLSDTVRLVVLSLWLMLAHVVSVGFWAWLYHHVGMNPTVEEALYFAFTTYTTLGFGDIVPPQDWRILTGISSANGLLLFGLSAAVLVDATHRLRLKPQ
ncbi:MAG: potassium channel family protein [Pseudomonadota bacterium]